MLCHIFSGGELKDTGFIKVSAGDMVICADSGLKYAEKAGIKPDIVLGDFDSYTGILPEGVRVLRSPAEKDDTDTMLALKTAIAEGADIIKIYGALGGRFDHALANVQTLKYAAEHGCEAFLEDMENIVLMQTIGTKAYPRRDGWYFSVFSYSPELGVRELSGVKYPLKNAVISYGFPIGVSNEIIAEQAVLDISGGIALVIRSKSCTG